MTFVLCTTSPHRKPFTLHYQNYTLFRQSLRAPGNFRIQGVIGRYDVRIDVNQLFVFVYVVQSAEHVLNSIQARQMLVAGLHQGRARSGDRQAVDDDKQSVRVACFFVLDDAAFRIAAVKTVAPSTLGLPMKMAQSTDICCLRFYIDRLDFQARMEADIATIAIKVKLVQLHPQQKITVTLIRTANIGHIQSQRFIRPSCVFNGMICKSLVDVALAIVRDGDHRIFTTFTQSQRLRKLPLRSRWLFR